MTVKTDINGLIPKTSLQKILGTQAVLVYPELAKVIGLANSICWQQLNYWINKESTTTIFEGRLWVYNTYEEWRKQLPFLSERTIRRSFSELEELGLILSRQAQTTKYYTIDYQALDSLFANELDNNNFEGVQIGQSEDENDEGVQNVQSGCPNWPVRVSNLDTLYIDTKTTQRLLLERDARETESPAETSMIVFSENAPLEKESKKVSKQKKDKGSSLDEDWVLPLEWRAWSLQCGMTNEEIDIAEIKFKNYWLSTTKNAVKKNWYMTWQNWCVNEYEHKGKHLKVPALPKPISSNPVPVAGIVQKSDNPRIQQWYNLQSSLRDMVGNESYNSWLGSNLDLIKAEDKAIFRVSSNFMRDSIRTRFSGYIANILAKIDPKLGKEETMEFLVLL